MDIKLSKSFIKELQRRVEGYDVKVGVLDDKEHKQAVETPLYGQPELKSYAGGPARKISSNKSGLSIGEVLVKNMERLGTNILAEPLEDESSEINKFTKAFLMMAMAKGSIKRVENLCQAIVRNPILRGDYGPNTSGAADNKGFDRHLIDTAQMFKAIKAKVTRV